MSATNLSSITPERATMLPEAAFPVAVIERDKRLYYLIKRIMDVALTLVCLVVLSPVLLLVALAVKLDSPGPVIFRQERMGYDWRRRQPRTFTMYKFRSMRHDSDQGLHQRYVKEWIQKTQKGANGGAENFPATMKLTHDPRITRVGRILRTTSLDELPQLWNVLRNEMSLVGPRPVPLYEVAEYKPWHAERLKAPPGLTGLWQITGRGRMGVESMVALDVEYINTQSVWLDVWILICTLPAVLLRRGAA